MSVSPENLHRTIHHPQSEQLSVLVGQHKNCLSAHTYTCGNPKEISSLIFRTKVFNQHPL